MKYILVTGGVFGGVGKTVISGAIGKLLKNHGVEVTFVKIDACLNLDAGTSSSGEVCVLEGGAEVDVDLGHYEKALDWDIVLQEDHHVTSGKIYREVIENERRGGYFRQIVRVHPHFTKQFRNHLERVARIPVAKTGEKTPEVCIVELNGAIDDIENQPIVECFKQFQFTTERSNFCMVHVSYVPKLTATGEHKIEPTQSSISKLQIAGLAADFVICRSESSIAPRDMEKISQYCYIPFEQIVNICDVANLFKIPHLLKCNGMAAFLSARLKLTLNQFDEKSDEPWQKLDQIIASLTQTVNVAVVGDYTSYKDRYPAIVEALKDAGYKAACRVAIQFVRPNDLLTSDDNILDNFGCVVSTGTFGVHDTEGHMKASRLCREKKIPFLGVGLGFHTAVIEIAETFDPKLEKEDVVMVIPEVTDKNVDDSMEQRCEPRSTMFKDDCTSNLRLLYLNRNSMHYWNVRERFNCKYQTNPKHLDVLEENGIRFIATDSEDEQIMDIMELADDVHPYFVGCRFHPEYSSTPSVPAPAFLGLVLAAKNQLKSYLIEVAPTTATHTVFRNYKKTAEDLRELEECNNVVTLLTFFLINRFSKSKAHVEAKQKQQMVKIDSRQTFKIQSCIKNDPNLNRPIIPLVPTN